MKLAIVSIYDRKAGDHSSGLLVVRSLAVAVREFTDLLATEGSMMAKHAEDFALYKVGDFDSETGEIENSYSLVIEASEVVRRQAPRLLDTDVEVNQLPLFNEA